MDTDIYEYALNEARRKRMTLASEFRWMLRDGYAHRLELERQYRGLAVEEAKYGW